MIGPPWWDDADVFLVGGGPSLRGFDFGRLEGRGHVVGLNQSMFDAPVECGVAIDHQFITNRRKLLEKFASERPLYLAVGSLVDLHIPGAVLLEREKAPGLSQTTLRCGATVGYTGLSLAVLKKAKRVFLLGYDYGTAENNAHHYHDAYPWHHKAVDMSWQVWVQTYEAAARDCRKFGVQVINTSTTSKLTYFPVIPLEEVLGDRVLRPEVLAFDV